VSKIFDTIKRLVASGEVRISDHGYDEMADDDIRVRDVLNRINEGVVVEEYPTFPKGPSVLVLQSDAEGRPIHVVWGTPKGHDTPAVLVTAYRPDPTRWSSDFMSRL
jgi:hypothetical protein